jgi:hypothetical protein
MMMYWNTLSSNEKKKMTSRKLETYSLSILWSVERWYELCDDDFVVLEDDRSIRYPFDLLVLLVLLLLSLFFDMLDVFGDVSLLNQIVVDCFIPVCYLEQYKSRLSNFTLKSSFDFYLFVVVMDDGLLWKHVCKQNFLLCKNKKRQMLCLWWMGTA